MKYLKYFEELSAYETYKNGSDYIEPNVSYVEENKVVFYIPKSEEPVAPVGASIYGLDGKFYTPEEWTLSGKSSDQAIGVAVSDGEHSFVIHPTIESSELFIWSSNTSVVVDNVFTTNNLATAESDFDGNTNTTAILAAVTAGIISDAPAAQYAISITFANGKTGYLPSVGELTLAYTKRIDIDNCITAIGGKKFDLENEIYWCSTQCSNESAWCWESFDKCCVDVSKYYTRNYVRPFTTL